MQLKVFLNEEIGRLKGEIKNILKLEEVKQDTRMVEKTKKVLELLESYGKLEIDLPMLKKVLKIQNFVNEAK